MCGHASGFAGDYHKISERSEISYNTSVVSRIKKYARLFGKECIKLEYINLLVDGERIKCLKYSGPELKILRKSLFPNKSHSVRLGINNCYDDSNETESAIITFSLL